MLRAKAKFDFNNPDRGARKDYRLKANNANFGNVIAFLFRYFPKFSKNSM